MILNTVRRIFSGNRPILIGLLLLFSAPQLWAVAPVPSFQVLFTDDGQQVFNGAATRDPDGGNFATFQYLWEFTPDPGGANSGIGALVIARSLSPGTYTLKLTVTDDDGEKASTSQTFVVPGEPDEPPANQKPNANADFSATSAGQPVAIDALANDSDPDGDDFSIVGNTQPSNGSVSVVGGGFRYIPDGGFVGIDTFSYSIRDTGGLEDTALVRVTVEDKQPTAPFSFVVNDLAVSFNWIGEAGDGEPRFSWSFGDGVTSVERNPTHVYSGGGIYNVSLTVRDTDDDTDTENRIVTVIEIGELAVDFKVVTLGNDPLSRRFEYSGSEGAGELVFEWNFGDGANSNERNVTHTFQSPGSYPVSLSVTDKVGQNSTQEKTLIIQDNSELDVAFTVTSVPENPFLIKFSYSGTEGAGGLQFDWNFGDSNSPSNTSTERDPTHVYSIAGAYTVTLVVTDNAGQVQEAVPQEFSVFDVVTDEDVKATIDTPDINVLEGSTVELSGRGFLLGVESGDLTWRQIPTEGAPRITISDVSSQTISFVAPNVINLESENPQLELKFELVVKFDTNPGNPGEGEIFDRDEVTVTVDDNGITEIPGDYITTRSDPDQNPFGVKVSQGGMYILEPYSLNIADEENTTNRPRRTPIGLVDLELHPDENGRATVEFRLFEPLPEDYIWYSFHDENGWLPFPDEDSGEKISINGESIILTLIDRTQPETRALRDLDENPGVIRLRSGPGQISRPTTADVTVESGAIGLYGLLVLWLMKLLFSRRTIQRVQNI